MKASKTKYFIVAALVVFGVLQAANCILFFRPVKNGRVGWDLDLRRNEVRCAHQGVSSFRIWNRETTLEGFVPCQRPDKEAVVYHEGDAQVHAYPPWHTTMFWFYGWLGRDACLAFMAVIFGFCLCFTGYETVRLSKERFKAYEAVAAISLILIAYSVTKCFTTLNYGVLLLAMFLLMNKALEKGHDILAGLAWAIMMIKPQVGFLFVWPLLWQKHYRTIITAAIVCFVATIGTSLLVHESVIDLILQVPKIGAPYPVGIFLLIKPIAGNVGTSLFTMVSFSLVGFGTWLLRKNPDFLVNCAPVALMIPIWTFTNDYDWGILLPAYILLAGRVFESRKFDALTLLSILYCFIMVFMHDFFINAALAMLPSVNDLWIHRIAKFAVCPLLPLTAGLFVYEKHKELRAEGGEACKTC